MPRRVVESEWGAAAGGSAGLFRLVAPRVCRISSFAAWDIAVRIANERAPVPRLFAGNDGMGIVATERVTFTL